MNRIGTSYTELMCNETHLVIEAFDLSTYGFIVINHSYYDNKVDSLTAQRYGIYPPPALTAFRFLSVKSADMDLLTHLYIPVGA